MGVGSSAAKVDLVSLSRPFFSGTDSWADVLLCGEEVGNTCRGVSSYLTPLHELGGPAKVSTRKYSTHRC